MACAFPGCASGGGKIAFTEGEEDILVSLAIGIIGKFLFAESCNFGTGSRLAMAAGSGALENRRLRHLSLVSGLNSAWGAAPKF